MALGYIRINKIMGLTFEQDVRYELSATLSTDQSVVTPTLLSVFEGQYLFSDNIWMLPFEENLTTQNIGISFVLVRGKTKYQTIAKLTLPVNWFPYDAVVRDIYPMKQIEEINPVYADVTVHITTRGADPFRDPPGKLLVKPKWQLPNQYNQYPQSNYIQFCYPRIEPPLGIPQIVYGPSPQIFTQSLNVTNPQMIITYPTVQTQSYYMQQPPVASPPVSINQLTQNQANQMQGQLTQNQTNQIQGQMGQNQPMNGNEMQSLTENNGSTVNNDSTE